MFSSGEISEKKKIIYVDFHLQKLLSRSFYSLYYYFPTVDKKKIISTVHTTRHDRLRFSRFKINV